MSPTSKALAILLADGWKAEIVEKWNPWAKIRQDLWGFVDVVAIKGSRTLALQVTDKSNMSKRVKKIESHINTQAVLAAWELEVWGFDPGVSKAAKIPRVVKIESVVTT